MNKATTSARAGAVEPREILASVFDNEDMPATAQAVREGKGLRFNAIDIPLKAIATALALPREVAGDQDRYLVWSNEHQAWWGPEHRGYTRHIDRAGRYDRAEALSIAGTRDGGWHVRKGNPDEIAIPERDAVEQYAAITAALASGIG